jgi:nickel/cobalt exporter
MSRCALLVVALAAPMLALIVAGLARPESAAAHPLGNFTVNRYSRLDLYSDAIRIRYVLDMAEIPAFQEVTAIDTDGDGYLSSSENDVYLNRKADEIVNNLNLSVNGSTVALQVLASDITYPEGQAGLPTLRIGLVLHSPTSNSEASLEYSDDNYSDRIGWKEIVVRPAQGVNVSSSTATSDDISSELTSYPADLLSSPLDVTSVGLSYSSEGGAVAPSVAATAGTTTEVTGAPERAGAGFASLVDAEELTLPVILLSLVLALGFGAIHALEPGHGKTLVAAYFVGVKGTVRQALGLGAIVAVTHTIGVLAIGLIVLFGSQYVLPERLYPWLSLASGIMVLALGVRLLNARAGGWRAVRRFAFVLRREGKRRHDHEHAHAHGHDHSPDAVSGAPPWKSLLALGLADGLIPSPSALVVLLAAVSLDRIGLGLLLIGAFSVGLAAVLTLVSLGLVYARRAMDWVNTRRSLPSAGRGWAWLTSGLGPASGIMNALPVGGAFVLLTVGVVLTVRALSQPELLIF